MKIEKFKVLLYLKKSRPDKSGKAPIMGRITVNRSMVQFSCKLSCTPDLWNPRESRLNGKSNEAVEVNAKLDKLQHSTPWWNARCFLMQKRSRICFREVSKHR